MCSYLLIGFWYEKPTARAAAVKAFITTRIGDTIMFVGMMLLYVWSEPSTLVIQPDAAASQNLEQPGRQHDHDAADRARRCRRSR